MKKINTIILASTTAIFLSACGAGNDSTENTGASNLGPMQLKSSNWQMNQAKLTSNATLTTRVTYRRKGGTRTSPIIWDYLNLVVNGVDKKSAHQQFLIDIDNDPKTGFQSSLWSDLSGIDYLIQDGDLYKSMSNDSTWNWKWIKRLDLGRNS